MSVEILRSPTGDVMRSPFNDLICSVPDFDEECEILIVTDDAPVPLPTGDARFTFDCPDRSAANLVAISRAMPWSLIPPHGLFDPFPSQRIYYYVDDSRMTNPEGGPHLEGPRILPGGNWPPWDWYGGLKGRLWPRQYTQHTANSQFSLWLFLPGSYYESTQSDQAWFTRPFVCQRARFRCTRPVQAWIGGALIYHADPAVAFPPPGDPDPVPNYDFVATRHPPGLFSGIHYLKLDTAVCFGPTLQTLPANTWLEIPMPSAPFATENATSGFLGWIYFGVYGMTPAEWSALNGVQITTVDVNP